MKEEREMVLAAGLKGASQGGAAGMAGSVLTGLAVEKTKVTTLWGLITMGSTMSISWPVVIACGIGGAILLGIIGAASENGRIARVNGEFDAALKTAKKHKC